MMELLQLIINVVLGGSLLGLLIFYRSKKRKQSAEADQQEASAESLAMQNLQQSLQEWKEIAQAREDKIDKKDATIDRLYQEKAEGRKLNYQQAAQINQLDLELSNAKVRVCNARACEKRTPPSELF